MSSKRRRSSSLPPPPSCEKDVVVQKTDTDDDSESDIVDDPESDIVDDLTPEDGKLVDSYTRMRDFYMTNAEELGDNAVVMRFKMDVFSEGGGFMRVEMGVDGAVNVTRITMTHKEDIVTLCRDNDVSVIFDDCDDPASVAANLSNLFRVV